MRIENVSELDYLIDSKVRDKVTGYKGTVTGFASYRSGINQVLVESTDNTGRPVEWWIDVKRISKVQEQ